MSEVVIKKKEFDEVFEKMCDEYCRFPFVLETQEQLNEKCKECPANNIIYEVKK